jgi:hypothetical protein
MVSSPLKQAGILPSRTASNCFTALLRSLIVKACGGKLDAHCADAANPRA